MGTWKSINSMTQCRSGLGVGVMCGLLYAIGGHTTSDCSATAVDDITVLNTAEVYNPKTKNWKLIAPMNVARTNLAVTVVCDKLYAIGGDTNDDTSTITTTNTVEVYNPKTNKWKIINGKLNISRSGLGSASLANKLYAFGGIDNNGEVLNSAETAI